MLITICDTETTGLLKPDAVGVKEQPYIAEFYGCTINEDFEIVRELDTFIKPPIPLSEEITKITGITNDMVANAPTFADVYPELCHLYEGVRCWLHIMLLLTLVCWLMSLYALTSSFIFLGLCIIYVPLSVAITLKAIG